ncbi:hypothetical protein FACS189428_5000 [Clostridia bacterium]|nr:hypothetical protein FACS189428_5000 [Clostridia bacterium]
MATKLGKKSDKPLFKQIIDLMPHNLFRKSVNKYKTDKHCSAYFTYDQLVSTMFGQLNQCLSLRDISLGIDQSPEFLADTGLSQSPAKSSMSAGNKKRNYKIFEDLYCSLVGYYRTAKGGIKAHVSIDAARLVPEIVNITEAKVSDRRGVDNFHYPKETIVVDDRGYFDCKLFRTRIDDGNWFVTRLKDNILYEPVRELDLPEQKDEHILKDEIIHLTGKAAVEQGLDSVELRRTVVFIEDEKTKEWRIIV